jgi:formiminotetrahydrofolate cyclodeaminase
MQIEDCTIRDFVDSLAAKTPTPGGGAAAALLAALAAALAQMVVNYSIGKKSLIDHEALNRAALESLGKHAANALQLARADAAAYARLNELLKRPEGDAQRTRDLPAAVQSAIDAPNQVLRAALEMLRQMQQLCGTTNAMLKSDLAIAAVIAEAAARAAAWNVRINLPLLKDDAAVANLKLQIESSLESASSLCEEIEQDCS